MIVSIHQPAYLPWLGYLDKIAKSDIHVFLDNVQMEKGSFTNRNQIKTPHGPLWLTIPIIGKGHTHSTILETNIANKQNWGEKHLKSIRQNYSKSSLFRTRFPRLEAWYANNSGTSNLSELCFSHLKFWLNEFNIETRIFRSSEMNPSGAKSDLVLSLCKTLDASTYLSGSQGKNYLRESDFSNAGISITYQEFQHPVYHQLHGPFLPAMSIVDYWLNEENNYFPGETL